MKNKGSVVFPELSVYQGCMCTIVSLWNGHMFRLWVWHDSSFCLSFICYHHCFQIHKRKQSLENSVTQYILLSALQVGNDWHIFPPRGSLRLAALSRLLGASSVQRRCTAQTGIIDLTWLDSSWFRLLYVLVALSTSSTNHSTVKMLSIWRLQGLPDSFMNQNLSACCAPATLAKSTLQFGWHKNSSAAFWSMRTIAFALPDNSFLHQDTKPICEQI